MDTQETIRKQIEDNPVILYMKGTPQFPQCGFSALAVEIIAKHLGGADRMETVNVLMEPEIRQGIKEYSSWPTIPQLYINGEFIGGADIIKQLHEQGELEGKLSAAACGGLLARKLKRLL